jgi:hypothetical protein
MQERKIGDLLATAQFLGGQLADGAVKMLIVGAHATVRVDHFIERAVKLIFVKGRRQGGLARGSRHDTLLPRASSDREGIDRTISLSRLRGMGPIGRQRALNLTGGTMSFAIYLVGYVVLIVGLAIGAHMMHVPDRWIGVGAIVLAGLGILTGVARTRQRDPS